MCPFPSPRTAAYRALLLTSYYQSPAGTPFTCLVPARRTLTTPGPTSDARRGAWAAAVMRRAVHVCHAHQTSFSLNTENSTRLVDEYLPHTLESFSCIGMPHCIGRTRTQDRAGSAFGSLAGVGRGAAQCGGTLRNFADLLCETPSGRPPDGAGRRTAGEAGRRGHRDGTRRSPRRGPRSADGPRPWPVQPERAGSCVLAGTGVHGALPGARVACCPHPEVPGNPGSPCQDHDDCCGAPRFAVSRRRLPQRGTHVSLYSRYPKSLTGGVEIYAITG